MGKKGKLTSRDGLPGKWRTSVHLHYEKSKSNTEWSTNGVSDNGGVSRPSTRGAVSLIQSLVADRIDEDLRGVDVIMPTNAIDKRYLSSRRSVMGTCKENDSRYLVDAVEFSRSLKGRCMDLAAANLQSYNEHYLRGMVSCLGPQDISLLSSLSARHNTQDDNLVGIFAHSNVETLTIGSKVGDLGFQRLFRGLSSVASEFESWEEVEWDAVDFESPKTSVRSICLLRTTISLERGLGLLRTDCPNLQKLILHGVLFKDLNPRMDAVSAGLSIFSKFLIGFSSLEELHISHCSWLTLSSLEIWSNGIAMAITKRNALHRLKSVTVVGFASFDGRDVESSEIVLLCGQFKSICGIDLSINGISI